MDFTKTFFSKVKGPSTSNEKTFLREHVQVLEELLTDERRKANETERSYRPVVKEMFEIKAMLNSYAGKFQGYKEINLENISALDKLRSLFELLKNQAVAHELEKYNRDIEIAKLKSECDFFRTENFRLTNLYFDNSRQSSAIPNKLHFDNNHFEEVSSGSTTPIKELRIKQEQQIQEFTRQIRHCREQLQMKDEIINQNNETVQQLQMVIKSKDHELNEYLTKNNEIQILEKIKNSRLTESFKKIASVIRTQDSIEKSLEKKLGYISERMEDHCKQLSFKEIETQANRHVIEQKLKILSDFQNDVNKYRDQVYSFQGNRDDRKYLDIKENLIKIIVKLDNIESQNIKEIIQERRKIIISAETIYNILERKAKT